MPADAVGPPFSILFVGAMKNGKHSRMPVELKIDN